MKELNKSETLLSNTVSLKFLRLCTLKRNLPNANLN